MNTAIIVAAGRGERFGSNRPKQFLPLLGKPLILHTIERFQACDAVDSIVLVLSDDGRDEFLKAATRFEFTKLAAIVAGGITRAESVKSGLLAVNADSADIIAVHDGARPIVTCDEITRTIEQAAETGAACLVATVTDTIKEVRRSHIVRTIDRSSLRRALTPQAFRYDIIRRAFDGADLGDDAITDECSLVERLGVEITIVEGSSRNIKITHPEDLVMAEAYLRDI
jgi:2-C-methyl-D-erythritol 4-phosphate cytidylyltransferase